MTPDETFKPMTDILRDFIPIGWDDQQFCKYCGKVVVLIKSSLGFDDVVHTHSGEIYCDFPSEEKL